MTETIAVPSYEAQLQGLRQQLGQMLPADKLAVFDGDATRLAKEHAAALPLKVGVKAPGFALPNAKGKPLDLQDMLQQGPVVLTFYRGVWCPYCNLQLKIYQQILPQIREAGAQLVAVSPMTPDKSGDMATSNSLDFEVLSDVNNRVARQYTTVIVNPKSSISAMAELGYDFFSFYGDDLAELPVPATYVIARDGTILFAASEGGDYRQRIEPRSILDALRS
jgi:peroxiredoxin